jgi:hypothetical protein
MRVSHVTRRYVAASSPEQPLSAGPVPQVRVEFVWMHVYVLLCA